MSSWTQLRIVVFSWGLPHFVALSVVACSPNTKDAAPGDWEVLAPLSDLEFLNEAEDPLSSHRPSQVVCNNLTGYYREEDALEVDTARCNYLSVAERARRDAKAGESLETEISHFDLTAPEPATAHLALLVREHVIFEQTVEIPGPGNVIAVSVPLPVDVATGDRIGIHLHNHGQNTWNVGPIMVRR
jgi:hypothetical protein